MKLIRILLSKKVNFNKMVEPAALMLIIKSCFIIAVTNKNNPYYFDGTMSFVKILKFKYFLTYIANIF